MSRGRHEASQKPRAKCATPHAQSRDKWSITLQSLKVKLSAKFQFSGCRPANGRQRMFALFRFCSTESRTCNSRNSVLFLVREFLSRQNSNIEWSTNNPSVSISIEFTVCRMHCFCLLFVEDGRVV